LPLLICTSANQVLISQTSGPQTKQQFSAFLQQVLTKAGVEIPKAVEDKSRIPGNGNRSRQQKLGIQLDEEEDIWNDDIEYDDDESLKVQPEQKSSLNPSTTLAPVVRMVCNICNSRFTAADLQKHVIACEYVNTRCADERCNMVVQKQDMQEHIRVQHQLVSCECGIEVMKSYLDQHRKDSCACRVICWTCDKPFRGLEWVRHQPKCENTPEKCSACLHYVKRKELRSKDHKDNNCITICADCKIQIPKLDLDEHKSVCEVLIAREKMLQQQQKPLAAQTNQSLANQSQVGWDNKISNPTPKSSSPVSSGFVNAPPNFGNIRRPSVSNNFDDSRSTWWCSVCTFENSGFMSKCEMCQEKRN
jgi:hypothetical protein